jgi:nucleoside-diphosphate-sugar epimerase
MKIGFLGSNSFLASAFGKYFNKLNRFPDVYGRSSPTKYEYSTFTKFDILDKQENLYLFLNFDLIFYFAGQGIQSYKDDKSNSIYEVNAFFPIKLMIFLRENEFRGKFITFGSYFEIGNCNQYIHFNEIDLINSRYKVPNNYCVSKRIMTKFVDSFENNFTYHFILPTIYGEGEDKNRLIPYIIGQIKKGADIQLTSGEQIREYIYVDDVSEIISKAFDNLPYSGIYNISGTEKKEVKELAIEIAQYLGYNINRLTFGGLQRVDISMKYLLLDGTKLNSVIGVKPNTRIKDKIKSY